MSQKEFRAGVWHQEAQLRSDSNSALLGHLIGVLLKVFFLFLPSADVAGGSRATHSFQATWCTVFTESVVLALTLSSLIEAG